MEITNPTTLKLRLQGGISGDYTLSILRTDQGYATVSVVNKDKFSYGIYIDSIAPVTGSKFGGTTITITGQNFDTNKA